MLCVVILLSQASFSVQLGSNKQNKLLQRYTASVKLAQHRV
jgi:hypothetical protein